MPRNLYRVLLLLLTYSVVFGAREKIKQIYSKKLESPGYYSITTIPKGATAINVTDLARTKNFFAVRLDNEKYVFNGNYTIDQSGRYRGAGTFFVYIRHSEWSPETFYSPGPLDSPVDVMLVYDKLEIKVLYEYELPVESTTEASTLRDFDETKPLDLEAPSTTHFSSTNSANIMLGDDGQSSTAMPRIKKKGRFVWKFAGFTNCSKPCGGGYQSKIYICMRHRRKREVPDKKCIDAKYLEKPKAVTLRCNGQLCLPQWEAGEWSKCSTTCGNGTRTRELQCMQEMSSKLRVRLEIKHCPTERPSTIALENVCHMPDCRIYMTTPKPNLTTRQYVSSLHWKVEEWSACSVTCGRGRKTRVVTCVTKFGRPCNMALKPASEESCDMGSCTSKSLLENGIPEALVDSPWLYSAWPEECSSECGWGTLSRRLFCENFLKNETCSSENMPNINQTCFSGRTCGQWFSGPWTKCSSSCDIGIETREVACVFRLLGVLKLVDEINCPKDKPKTMQACMSPSCNATWFMSDWTECSRSCGTGTQKREVKCVGPDGRPINAGELECDEEKRPISKRSCNDVPCEQSNAEETNAVANVENKPVSQKVCRDTLPDCYRIREKSKESRRKCQSQHYKIGCCKKCRYYY